MREIHTISGGIAGGDESNSTRKYVERRSLLLSAQTSKSNKDGVSYAVLLGRGHSGGRNAQ